tara:strand:+ start:406 stop:834 length:429 start_codon:yes stop_codon:yes gene_type:complete
MATIKKACKGGLYPKSSSVSGRIGAPSKAKKGGKFDLNGDGKTTFKDVLIGRGVLPKTAKKGMKMKKAEDGDKLIRRFSTPSGTVSKYRSQDDNYKTKVKKDNAGNITKVKEKRTIKGMLSGVPKPMKTGGKMTKKCKYGCY